MSNAASGWSTALYVGVGVGTYSHWPPLPEALHDVNDVGEALLRYGYRKEIIPDPTLLEAQDRIRHALPRNILAGGGVLVVLWSGHGEWTHESKVHLITKDVGRGEIPVITSEYLADAAVRTGASQILLILDTCHSGGGTIPALAVADQLWREYPKLGWLGVMASARDFERARDGLFGERLVKLLRDGPAAPELRLPWSPHSVGVRGDDVVKALVEEWDVPGQQLKRADIGNASVMFPNPLYVPKAPERVVEHLLLAARGVDPGEEGSYFTGRTATLERIVTWVRGGECGVFVVTGGAGSGKSAIVGRIVSLSNPSERAKRLAEGPLEHADPGEGSVHAHVHARGLTVERFVELVDEQLVGRGMIPHNSSGPRNRGELLGAIERGRKRPVIAVDGFDEAGSESWYIAEDVIRLLAPASFVLIGTRDLQSPGKQLSLIQTVGPTEILDLSDEAKQEDTRSDVIRYVEKRLAIITPPSMDKTRVGEAIVQLVQKQREGIFLLARVITAQLRADPIDTSRPGWESQLSRSVEAAFERDLSRVPRMRRGDRDMPGAARELLTALAWGYGAGLPDDVWPVVATALSPTAATYERDDVFWLLREAGRYVVEDGEEGRAVYRLSHKRFAEHLRPATGVAPEPEAEAHAANLALALIDYYLRLLGAGQRPQDSPYLWQYAWRHCADAGQTGIKGLRRLVQHAPEAFRPDLAGALNSLGIDYSEVGRWQEAVAPTEEAVSVYRELAATNPAFLSDLAGGLNNLGNRYRDVGRWQEAVAPTEEAVSVYRELAATNPAFRPGLAGALNNLGSRYSDVGRRQEAVAPTEEAVSVFRELAATNPSLRPDLAVPLSNLGILYGQVGRRQEAVTTAEEAVSIRRELAATNPAFRPNLAMALDNLSISYGNVGRWQEAVAPTEEAVSVFRELAATNPAFLPDLALALNNLGIRSSEMGRRQEAVGPAEEAVSVFRELAATNPAFRPKLAMTLHNLGLRYSEVGHRQEAVAPTEEAVSVFRELAATNPTFLPDLAGAVNDLGIRYSEVGRRQEVVVPAEEAVSVFRELAATNPAFRPDLAGMLNNLGVRYSEVGRRQEAVAPTEEAVSVFRELAATNPASRPDLAMALNNLGSCYSEVGRLQEGLAPAEEAVSVYRELAAINPTFRPGLAGALNNLGIRYSDVGRRQEAVASVEEAVSVYRELAAVNPAFRPNLALALNTLGGRYEAGRRHEAVASVEEAVSVYRELAATNAAFSPPLARALNNLGILYSVSGRGDEVNDMWDVTITSLANPADRAFLLLRRAEAGDSEDPAVIDDLLAAKSLAPGEDRELIADLQAVCRALRARNASAFDQEWRRRSEGDLPAWLLKD